MSENRDRLAKFYIYGALFYNIVLIISGIIIPKLLIGRFGSEVYGATASITQFLGYIVLIESGIGTVARVALYKPLAEKNIEEISGVYHEIKHYFTIVGGILFVYTAFLALSFHHISHVEALDWTSTFLLVIAISVSSFAQYFIGVPNSILIQSAQRPYIVDLIKAASTILNTAMVALLIWLGCDIITVKLVSSCIFALCPILQWLYV